MSHEQQLVDYSRQRLAGREIPADLRTLLLLHWQGSDGPLSGMGASLLEANESHDLLDHSYLNDKDRADPDIMANVAAIKSTCEHAAFVAQNQDGNVFGYWFGPENVGINDAPIVKLDTEGQFDLLGGRTLSEALLGDHVFEDAGRFAEFKTLFAAAGIAIAGDSWDDLVYPKPPTTPGAFHEKLYRENQQKEG